MRLYAILMSLGLALGQAFPAVAAPVDTRITVTGQGHAEAAPDMATISLGVLTQAKTAAAAMQENSQAVARVLESVKASGVAARDMQTTGLSLSPVWDNRSSASGQARMTGFQARNMVVVRVRKLDSLGGVLDKVVQAGANTFNGLQFGLGDMQPLADAARQAAVADALRKAQLFAKAAGVELGPVQTISEGASGGLPRPEMRRDAVAMDSMPVPVAEGEITVNASVTMVFALLPKAP